MRGWTLFEADLRPATLCSYDGLYAHTAPSRPTASGRIAGALNRTGGAAHASDVIDSGRAVYLEIMDREGDGISRRQKMLSLASAMDKALPRKIRNELYEFTGAGAGAEDGRAELLHRVEHAQNLDGAPFAALASASASASASSLTPSGGGGATGGAAGAAAGREGELGGGGMGGGGADTTDQEPPASHGAMLDNYSLSV